jgi:uncharacterized protein DUF4266
MTRRAVRLCAPALLLLLLTTLGGCAAMRVHPWDRDLLADKRMRFVPCPMVHAVDEHVYFSKEGSTGGEDPGGGGCGCN